jgi:hypothetical protein
MKRKEKLDIENFLKTQNKRELSESLDIAYKILTYNLHKLPDNKKYTEFEIKKRSGGTRAIAAPMPLLSLVSSIFKRISLTFCFNYIRKKIVYMGIQVDEGSFLTLTFMSVNAM